MWTSLIFLTIVGLAACSTPWQANQQYEYAYTANTLTGYGLGKDQYVGIITKGKLILQPETESVVRGKLSQVRHAHFHAELKDGLNSKIPDQKLSYSDEPQSESLFSINYKNGVIRSLDVDQSMSNDDVNQLKAVLSQMQVDTTGENIIKCRHNQLPTDSPGATNALYKTMEPTVTGECETLYEMSAVPAFSDAEETEKWAPQTELTMDEGLLQFVKTVNYSNCDVRRGYHFGISGASDMKPNSNQMGEFLSKASVTRVTVAGPLDHFTIRSVETTNRVAVSPMLYDNDQAEVISRIALELESITKIESPLTVNSENLIHVGNLVYRYNIPSDIENQPRTSAKSSNDQSISSYSSSNEQLRQRRSTDSENHIRNQKQMTSSSSSSSSSSESSEEFNSARYAAKYPHHYQPYPTTKQAADQPMHPFSIGNRGRSIQFHNSIDAVAEGRKLAEEISTDLQSQAEIETRDTLEKYTILAELIQTMDYEQIEHMLPVLNQHQGNSQLGEQLVENTLMDAVAQAGTNPAVSYIVKGVSNGQIRGSQAASLLETVFKNLRTPTEPIVREIFENIIKNEKVRKQSVQYPSILINYADLLRRAYSDKNYANNYYPVQSYGSFEKALGEIVTEEIVPWMGKRLADNMNKKNQQKSLKYIRALGNVAHPKIVEVFEPYLEDEKSASSFERLAIVAAFDKIVESYPKYAQKILFKIYSNVAEEPEIRSIAVALLMRTDPPATILQRMAMSTYNDPSTGVRTTVKSAINSAAQLTSSENANLAANAKAAQKFLNPHTFGLQTSKTLLRDHVSQVLQISEEYQMSHIMGPDSTFPNIMSFTSWKNYGGINMNEIDVQALLSSVQNVLDTVVSNEKSKPTGSQKSKYSAQNIIKELGINFGSENNNEVAGQLLFKMLGRKNFVSFDAKTLEAAPTQLAGIVQELMSGHQMQFNKIYDHQQIEVAFPLATGYPFYYSYKSPILLQTLGDVKARTTPSLANSQTWSNIRDMQAINVTTKARFTFSMEKIGKAGFITPFERQRYVAGQIQKLQIHVPLSATLNIDLKNTAVSGKVAPLSTDQEVKLLHASSWPFTARKNALSLRPVAEAKEVKLIEVRPTVGDEHTFGEDSIGMAFHLRTQHQFSQSAVNAMERLLQNEGIKQYSQLPVSLILTMQSLVKQQSIVSPVQLLPYLFEPATQSTSSGNILLSLLTMPFYQDVDITGLTKLRAALSLASLPFADASELKKITKEEDISANGPWPKSGVAHYKFTLSLDLQRSANQAVKFGVQIDNKGEINDPTSNRRSDKPLSSSDESKLALVSDIAPNSESRREEMILNAARDMKQASAALIDSALVFDGSKPAKFVGTIAQADNSVGDKTRILLFGSAKTSTGGPAKQVYASFIRNFANTPALNFYNAQKHNGKSNAKLTVTLGEGGKPKNTKLNVKIIMDQSDNYRQQLLQSTISQECEREMREEDNYQMPACLKATFQANLLDHFHVIAETEQPTSDLKNFAQSIYSVLNHWGYYNSKVDQSKKGQPGKLEAKINFNDLQQSMNMTIQLPSGQQNFTGLPIPRNARYLFPVHPGMNLEERTMHTMTRNSEVCVIDQTKILTFDNALAEEQVIGKCWYAVLEHINPTKAQDELSVLVRQANEGGNKREVQIVTAGQRIQLLPSNTPNSPPQVTVNEKPQQVLQKSAIDVHASSSQSGHNNQDKTLVARIYLISETDLKVELHGSDVKIYYDGASVRVHAAPKLRNRVAGLCGTYNGEENDDIATPQQKVLQNQKYYTAHWAVGDETCDSQVQQAQQRAQSARLYEVKYQAGNVVSSFENGKKFEGKRQSDSQWQSSESSSSSSESNENQQNKYLKKAPQTQGNKSCEVVKRVQFLTQKGSYCFTTVEVNTCPSHCVKKDQVTIEVPAHCRAKTDSVANMFVQQIRRGSNPDLSSKAVTQTIQITVPRACAAKQ